MADLALAERSPLANCLVPGRHGRAEGEPGVALTVHADLRVTLLLVRKDHEGELRASVASAGHALPERGRFDTTSGVAILWAGPDQWIVIDGPDGRTTADRLVSALSAVVTAVDQSAGRLVIDIGGPKARAVLAKGVQLDLHSRSFAPGMTALTIVAGIAVQICQLDNGPTFRIAVPSSFAEAFWGWLTQAAAEYGFTTEA